MAHVPVTINGIAYPKNKKDPPYPVTIIGYAWITGLGVGGGPLPGGPGAPGAPPRPTHPIVLPPEGGFPDAHPEHPIVIPPDPPPVEIPTPPTDPKPPPPDGGWGWSPEYGWGYFPPEGEATPKRR